MSTYVTTYSGDVVDKLSKIGSVIPNILFWVVGFFGSIWKSMEYVQNKASQGALVGIAKEGEFVSWQKPLQGMPILNQNV